ncbi:microsomal glutathione S-transferase 1 [Haematobia irritans]|uniref:microsomal glutathione S-transferase 1 n=1 Tax=Haematobia irritans TaxID=7368 RepID=UPI003F5089F7
MTNETLKSSNLNLLSTDNPVFNCYCFWSSVLVIKMLMMTLLTASKRIKKKVFANPEDLKLAKSVAEVVMHDPDVERVRRAHRNDLENILPFLLITLVYIATGPNALAARMLIRIGASCRLLHTGVYAFGPVPQPTRAILFFITFTITVFMVFCVIIKMAKYI